MRCWLITEDEDDALHGLPHTAQIGYHRGIRPYMDRATGLVGVKRAVSYMSIAVACEVSAVKGRHASGWCQPSRKMGRHIVDVLESVNLVERQPADGRTLVLRLPLATVDQSVSAMRGNGGAKEGQRHEGHTETESTQGIQGDEGQYEGQSKNPDEGHTSVISNQRKDITPPKSPPLEFPDWLPAEAWAGFVEMRKKIRAPLTDRAVTLAINRLDQLRQSGEDVGAVLDQSTVNDWKSLYPVKDDGLRTRSGRTGKTLSESAEEFRRETAEAVRAARNRS